MSRSLLVIGAADVRRLLPMDACIDAMANALAGLARGDALLPLRTVLTARDGSFYVMPAWTSSPPALVTKLLTLIPQNPERGLPAIQGVVVAFDPDDCAPAALIEAGSLTALRTAAVSAAATRLLAREDASTLALIGSGVEAETHLEAMCAVRALRDVRVWSPTRVHRERFARQHGVRAAESAEAAVRGADIVCTLTTARSPVVMGEWLDAGAHVNAVGASAPDARELDGTAMRRGRLFVDQLEAARAEAGDYLLAVAEGAIERDHIAGEIGAVLTGRIPGRTTRDEITIFESLGLAVEDAAAAASLLERAAADPHVARVVL